MRHRLKNGWRLLVAMSVAFALLPVSAAGADHGFLTSEAPYLTLDPGLPRGAWVLPIITVGETVDGVLFEGLPDGIGVTAGTDRHTVDVYINHEQTTIPFFGTADFQDASVTKLTLSTKTKDRGAVLHAEVAISSDDGYKRFCSASMGTVAEGFDVPVFLTGEEANDITAVPLGAPYGSDPSVAPDRQVGYAVVLNTETGESTPVPGMGRLNHENTIALPGYNQLALLTTDDTFSGPGAQLYLYTAANQDDVFDDKGSLFAFQVTHDSDGPVDPGDAFNGANDYLDLVPGVDDFQGRFILVPENIAKGTTSDQPQQALEDWSNDNNIFQFIRLEDLAYDKNDPNVVYIADTGRTRIIPDPTTGRLQRGPSNTVGFADNGSVFKMVFDEDDPTQVTSFTVLAQGDDSEGMNFVPFVNPDNMDTSKKSLMLQEDRPGALIWRYRLRQGTWAVVASVNDPGGESSGIVDASAWYGQGIWLLDVQAHSTNVTPGSPGLKREDGQLLLMKIPGS